MGKYFNKMLAISTTLMFSSGAHAMVVDYGDFDNAKQISIRLKGENAKGEAWTAESLTPQYVPFMTELFADAVIMKGFAGGGPRDKEATKERMEKMWLTRNANGQPHGGMVVLDEKTQPIGHIVAGGGDGPGVSEIAYSYIPSCWGKGFGFSVLNEIVEIWGPTVRLIGLGKDPAHNHENIVTAFRCFGGKVLERFDATASPKNPGSWKILDKVTFQAAITKCEEPPVPVDFDGKEFASYEALEERLVLLYDAGKQDKPFTPGVRYAMIDDKGLTRTFSFVESYKGVKYHFERPVLLEGETKK